MAELSFASVFKTIGRFEVTDNINSPVGLVALRELLNESVVTYRDFTTILGHNAIIEAKALLTLKTFKNLIYLPNI